jgi:hypothetical protein
MENLMIRPRLTDYHEIYVTQAETDFAIPFLNEDIPLYELIACSEGSL